jgi:lysophospholipid acyltransferase (LPLAT)-like uncharacterized protein
MLKLRTVRRRLVAGLAVEAGWLLLRLLRLLVRVQVVGGHHFTEAAAAGRPVLIAIWHGRILLPILQHRGQGIVPMVSLSRDGEMIARTVEKLGYRTIRGSSSKGGREAMRALIGRLSVPGTVGAIMPDGPKGPRHVLKPGVVQIARDSGAVVLPMTWGASHPIRFKSWDRFQVWRPFSRAVVIYGKAVPMPLEGDFRSQCENLAGVMVALEQEADGWFMRGNEHA